MTAVLLTPLTGQFFDNNGNPLSGGLVYSYVAGTSFGTPLATYTNATGTIAASNPVVLNSAGRADIWGSGTYDFKITDSVGNVIDTISSVSAIFGTGDMTKAVYDPANIAQQVVGTTAVQTISNKTFDATNTFTGIAPWGAIAGFTPSGITGTSTTAALTVSAGQATDSTNTSAITKATTTSWSVTNGNAANGYQGGTTLPNSATIDFYAISGSSGQATFAVQNGTALVLPTGYTLSRFIFSLTTTGAGALNADIFNEVAGGAVQVYLAAQLYLAVSATTTASLQTMPGIPLGRKRYAQAHFSTTTAAYQGVLITSPDEVDVAPSINAGGGFNGTAPGFNLDSTSSAGLANPTLVNKLTNISSQLRFRGSATTAVQVVVEGYVDNRRS